MYSIITNLTKEPMFNNNAIISDQNREKMNYFNILIDYLPKAIKFFFNLEEQLQKMLLEF